MKPLWHDGDDAPIASDGSTALVGHIGSRAQAERWQIKGYDIAQATDRYIAFLAKWKAAKNPVAADALVDSFYATESKRVRAAGINEDDPDFYRMRSAAKYHEWI